MSCSAGTNRRTTSFAPPSVVPAMSSPVRGRTVMTASLGTRSHSTRMGVVPGTLFSSSMGTVRTTLAGRSGTPLGSSHGVHAASRHKTNSSGVRRVTGGM